MASTASRPSHHKNAANNFTVTFFTYLKSGLSLIKCKELNAQIFKDYVEKVLNLLNRKETMETSFPAWISKLQSGVKVDIEFELSDVPSNSTGPKEEISLLVKIVERARAENESPIVTVAKHRTVTLLPTSVVRSSGEFIASGGEGKIYWRCKVFGDGGDQGVLFDFRCLVRDNVDQPWPVTEQLKLKFLGPNVSKEKRDLMIDEGIACRFPSTQKIKGRLWDYWWFRYWRRAETDDLRDWPILAELNRVPPKAFVVLSDSSSSFQALNLRPGRNPAEVAPTSVAQEASSSSLKSQNQSLVDQVHELEISSADLREKLEMYEGLLKWLEEFQDNLMGRPLRTRLAEIDADFTRCCMRFQESFHPHLLNVVAGQRWLLTHGMKLLVRMSYNSAIRDLHDLNFPLLKELSDKKDASTWDIMDLLRLDDTVAETLGMTDLQPDINQLMVPIHHKQDRVVIGSQALSVALDICHGRVEKMERNLIERLPFLKDVFVSIDDPLSAEDLIEPPAEVPSTNVLSTVVIIPHAEPSVSVEDYDRPDSSDVVPENATLGSENEGRIDASAGGGLTFSQLDDEAIG
ncbi:hypothetical protein Tco_0205324 [Tanacetum coccineum]